MVRRPYDRERRRLELERIDGALGRAMDALSGAAGLAAIASLATGQERFALALALSAAGLQLLREQ